MIKILHNPRCSKSRQGVSILETYGVPFKAVRYLDNPLTAKELKSIIAKLDIEPIDLVRKNEKIWKNEYKDKDLSNEEIIEAMVTNPKLIERPIVIKGNKAVIGRPTENILKILN